MYILVKDSLSFYLKLLKVKWSESSDNAAVRT